MERLKSGTVEQALIAIGPSHIAALVPVIRRLSVARSMNTIMEIVTQAARALLGADGITFVLRDGDSCYYAEEEAIAPLWKGRRFPLSSCISGWTMLERKAAIIPDIYVDPRIPVDAYKPTFVRSLAMVPVRQDDPVAAMGAYWSRSHEASAAELELLQAIANTAALTVAKLELETEHEKAHTARPELHHRIKNLLCIINSNTRQTAKTASTYDAFIETFSNRLGSLSKARSYLCGTSEEYCNLRGLVQAQLIGDEDAKVTCFGPDVRLAPDEAFYLGLALHELATNARKYGTLSGEVGRVTVAWSNAWAADRSTLELSWSEEGGPVVSAPTAEGFGSVLIRSVCQKAGGQADVRYEPGGVVWRLIILQSQPTVSNNDNPQKPALGLMALDARDRGLD